MKLFRKKTQSEDVCCDDVHAMASDYTDQELKEPVLVKVQRHLSFCPPCQSFLASFGKTVGLLRQVPKEQCPDSVRQGIIEKTKQS